MAIEAGELIVRLRAKIDELEDGLKQANQKIVNSSSTFVKNYGAIAGAATAAGAAIAAVAVSAFKEYAAGERVAAQFTQAMKNQGVESQALVNHFLDYADSLQAVTTLSNDTITETMTLLTTFGMTGNQLKETTKSAIDLSKGLGIDLKSATLLLGKAFVGETSSLSRYGITIGKGGTEAQRFEKVMAQVNQRFGGAAQKDLETAEGKMENMANRFADLQKRLGEELIPVFDSWLGLLNKAVTAVERLTGKKRDEATVDEIALDMLKKKRAELIQQAQFTAQNRDGIVRLTEAERQQIVTLTNLIGATEKRVYTEQKAKNEFIAASNARTTTLNAETLAFQEMAAKTVNIRAEMEKRVREQHTATSVLISNEITERTQKARESFEAQASYSQALAIRVIEDQQSMGTIMAEVTMAAVDNFGTGVAQMITEGKRFSDVIKNIWKDMVNQIIAEIARAIAKWLIFQAITGGSGGGFGRIFGGFAHGGMINEPSIITGLRSGKSHFAGEVGPEMIVPAGASSGSGAAGNKPFASPQNFGGGGGAITINISGQFLEGDRTKWQRLVRESIVPEIRKWTMSSPTGPFIRRRGSPG